MSQEDNHNSVSTPSNIADIAAFAVSEAPKPNEDVVSALIDKEKQNGADQTSNSNGSSGTGNVGSGGDGYTSTHSAGANPVGEQFDPAIHCANPDGTPKLKADGTYRRKPGRKTGIPGNASAAHAQSKAIPPQADFVDQCRSTAMLCTQLLFTVSSSILGEQWNPKSDNERANVEGAFAQYFVARGVPEMPPELALGIVLFGYAAPRWMHPDTQESLVKLGLKKPKVKQAQNHAPSDMRDNTLRQDSLLKAVSKPVQENGTQGSSVGPNM